MSSEADSFLLNYKIPEDVQINLQKLMKMKEAGIWGSDLLKEYEKVSKEDLRYGDYGYDSILHFCSSLSYIFTIVKHFKGDFKLFDPNGNVPPNLENLSKDDLKLMPSVLNYKDVIPRQQLVATNNMISIKIADVRDPSKFWFYPLSLEQKLNEVMGRMQLFYASTGKYYQIPSYKMRTQLYCATIYGGKFHRAVIVNILPELIHSVKVYFIDYGTVDMVMVKDVYFLHESFAEPNALAMRAQLAFVKPLGLNMPWSRDSTNTFIEYACNRDLQAQVDRREENGTVYILKLFDNAHGKKYWIHEVLVQNKFAVMNTCKQDEEESISEFVINKQMMHLKPTFADLESGIAPTKQEMDLLHDIRYPLQTIYEKYLKY